MFEQEHLAIASVPLQQWGSVYDEEEAFENGTIFPQLNKPFFAAEQGKSEGTRKEQKAGRRAEDMLQRRPDSSMSEEDCQKARQREEMLLKIQKASFCVDDMRLYMDTHPSDAQGLSLLKKLILKRKKLLREYALQFSPLTMDCMADIYEERPDSECYCWQKGPIPWEGACV